jgi:DNA-binding transcriptional LysR family regulator
MPDYKEYVYAVYQEKSFSRAAQKLYVSQPWLSAAVKKVEQEISFPIFDRSTTPISLTPEGKYYIAKIEEIMAIENEMARHFRELREGAGSEIHIGSSMFFCTYVLPSLIADFRAQHPQTVVTFSEGSPPVLNEKLENGALDVVLSVEQPGGKNIETVPWAAEELILGVPAGYEINRKLSEYCYTFDEYLHRGEPGGKKTPLPLSAMKDQPFIMLREDNDSHDRGLRICAEAGFTPKVTLYLTQMMTAYYLVCEGQGVTFLRSTIPEYVSSTDAIRFYQLGSPLAQRSLYLSYSKKKTSPMRQSFIDYILSEKRLGRIHQDTADESIGNR